MNDITRMLILSTTKIMKDLSTKEVVNEAEKGIWAAELWETLAESGMVTVAVPEELDGTGGDFVDAFHILRLAAKYSAPIPLAETYLANWLLAKAGQRVTGEPATIAWNYSQPFTFTANGDDWIVSGTADAVPWARYSSRLLVVGKCGVEAVLGVIDPACGQITHGENMAGEARDQVAFQEIRCDRTNCQLIPIDEQRIQEWIWHTGALMRSVMMAGALDRIMELTAAYSSERLQFGKPLHRFQAVQQQLALLAGEAAAADTAANYAVEAYQAGCRSKELAMAKIRINEAVSAAAPIAHQVHGAIGFTHEHSLHQSTRRVWSWREEFGTETEWGAELGELLFSVDHNKLWSFMTKKSF